MKINYTLEYFSQKNWAFVLIKNGKIIFKSKSQGLKPLIFCIKNYSKEMKGAIVYDKIIGQAAAILLDFSEAKEIRTPVMSQAGKKYLEKKKIKFRCLKLVKEIRNRKGDGICPMEKMSMELGEKAFVKKMLS